MRAPPDTVQPITGRRSLVAISKSRVIFSPTAVPMEPIMKPGSMANTATDAPSSFAVPVSTPSRSPLARLALSSFFSYSGNSSGSPACIPASSSSKLSRSVSIPMRRLAPTRRWQPHFRHTYRSPVSSSLSSMARHPGQVTYSSSGTLGAASPGCRS